MKSLSIVVAATSSVLRARQPTEVAVLAHVGTFRLTAMPGTSQGQRLRGL